MKKKNKKIIAPCWLLFLLLLGGGQIQAQSAAAVSPRNEEVSEKRNAFLFPIGFGFQLPAADMAKRFGWSAAIGGAVWRKNKNNFIIGGEGSYIFGTTIKEDSLAYFLYNPQGNITNTVGRPANIEFRESGFSYSIRAGKWFPFNTKRPAGGIVAMLGGGFLQHKIFIQEMDNAVPQFLGDYKKGYDRLTNGMALTQFVGYMHLNPRKRVYFLLGIDATEAFTRNRRSYTFDLQRSENEARLDVLLGLRAAWILPIFTGIGKSDYFVN